MTSEGRIMPSPATIIYSRLGGKVTGLTLATEATIFAFNLHKGDNLANY